MGIGDVVRGSVPVPANRGRGRGSVPGPILAKKSGTERPRPRTNRGRRGTPAGTGPPAAWSPIIGACLAHATLTLIPGSLFCAFVGFTVVLHVQPQNPFVASFGCFGWKHKDLHTCMTPLTIAFCRTEPLSRFATVSTSNPANLKGHAARCDPILIIRRTLSVQ
jgi:hypothetical protein